MTDNNAKPTDEQVLSELYWRCDPHGPNPNTLALEIWERLREEMQTPPLGGSSADAERVL